MNIIVELVSPGRFFKDAPIHSLNECLKKRGFEVVFAADQADLVRVVENNARLAGVVIDWEDSPQELCQQIHDFNEYLPVFAFSSSNSVTDATFQQLSLNVEFFEYEISNAADIAVTITQKVEEYASADTRIDQLRQGRQVHILHAGPYERHGLPAQSGRRIVL